MLLESKNSISLSILGFLRGRFVSSLEVALAFLEDGSELLLKDSSSGGPRARNRFTKLNQAPFEPFQYVDNLRCSEPRIKAWG